MLRPTELLSEKRPTFRSRPYILESTPLATHMLAPSNANPWGVHTSSKLILFQIPTAFSPTKIVEDMRLVFFAP